MRHAFTTLLFCTAAAAVGQSPIVGTDEFFQVGGSYWRDHYDQLPPVLAQDLLASGTAGYVLDLAPLNNAFLYTTDSLICDVATGPYFWFADYYDTANVMLEVWDELGNDAMYLFLEEPGRVQYVGGAPNGSFNEIVWQQFIDNVFRLELEDGITHGFAHTETIDGFLNDASGSDFHYTTGTRVLTADGYGSIIMPDGTLIENTLRLRSDITGVDSNAFFGINPFQTTLYTWYAEGIDGPLMTWGSASGLVAGYIVSSQQSLVLYRRAGGTGFAPAATVAQPLRIAPNPTNGPVYISAGEASARGTFSIVDPYGRTLQQWSQATAAWQVDLSDLAPGHYQVVYVCEGARSTRSLQIIP